LQVIVQQLQVIAGSASPPGPADGHAHEDVQLRGSRRSRAIIPGKTSQEPSRPAKAQQRPRAQALGWRL
jgi:hypothetical protein